MDNDAFTSTFTQIHQKLLGMAARILKNDDDAADLVQDAFCKLWQRCNVFQSASESKGVSVVTVRNMCIDKLRHDSSFVGSQLTPKDEARMSEESPPQDTDELYGQVRDIINKDLTLLQRRIIMMREYEGKDYETIANALGMKPEAVRVQLSRARKLVRELYKQKYKDNE